MLIGSDTTHCRYDDTAKNCHSLRFLTIHPLNCMCVLNAIVDTHEMSVCTYT